MAGDSNSNHRLSGHTGLDSVGMSVDWQQGEAVQDDLERINQKLLDVLGDLQKYAGKQIEDRLKGALDPALLQSFLKSAGFDASALSGMMGKVPSFDPYRVLGLDKSASDDEVKKRYHELLRKLHPDTSGTEGTSFLLQMVLVAFELIKRERGWQ